MHWPDGRITTGLETHVADLKQQFVFAPDTKIRLHPIKIAQGNCGPGCDGRDLQPTDAQEWLMWDNQSFMKQVGLAK